MYKIEALKELRDYLLANRELVASRFDMNGFATDDAGRTYARSGAVTDLWSHDCMTTACLAGWSVVMDINAGREVVDQAMMRYSMGRYIGDYDYGDEGGAREVAWDFLFSELWPDDMGQALGRIAYGIKHGTCPDPENSGSPDMLFTLDGDIIHE